MTDASWHRVGRALLGSWPDRVAAWGEEALAAYIEELGARGVGPAAALVAIRSCPAEQRFPPSAAELAALARRDPSAPTFDEAFQLIFGRGGMLKARTQVRKGSWEAGERDRLNEEAAWERAAALHPLIGAFVSTQGLRRLRSLNFDDPEWGNARRKQLADAWEEHIDVNETRDVAELVAGRGRGQLGRFDPLRALPGLRGLERAS